VGKKKAYVLRSKDVLCREENSFTHFSPPGSGDVLLICSEVQCVESARSRDCLRVYLVDEICAMMK
jgi:hypothetical protein